MAPFKLCSLTLSGNLSGAKKKFLRAGVCVLQDGPAEVQKKCYLTHLRRGTVDIAPVQ